ncbi:MAG: glycosyltransferase, partial [Schleiferiaceae bacterium]|nr:glycosyltransferase [Schleiferiaceae bacterium]
QLFTFNMQSSRSTQLIFLLLAPKLLLMTFEEFKALPVLMFNMSRWDGPISSASLSLAKVMGKTNDVYYFDYPYTFKDVKNEKHMPSVQWRLPALLKGKLLITKVTPGPAQLFGVTPQAVLPINWLPKGWWYEKANHWNNLRLAKAINQVLQAKNIKEYILFNSFIPSYLQDPKKVNLHPTLFAYHSRDNIRVLDPYTAKHGTYLERRTVKNADLAMGTASHLCEQLSKETGVPVLPLPNAADVNLFANALDPNISVPKELQNLPKPIVGYTGNLCQRIDYEALWHIGRNNPEMSFVFVGPRNDDKHSPYDLNSLPNFHFLGPRNITELPAYLKGFDATIIPFKCNELTKGIYPLKINEYLAAGKAVVATPFSKDIQSFGDVITLADGPEAFDAALHSALENAHDEKAIVMRNQRAAENSWEARTEQFWEMAWEVFKKK